MCTGNQRCGAEVATVRLLEEAHVSEGTGEGTCFPVFLFSKNERLILECVYVKYLSSLRSHVYRFISKITKSKTHRRGKLEGTGRWWTGLEAALEYQGMCVCGCEEPNPAILTWNDAVVRQGCPGQCRETAQTGLAAAPAVPHRGNWLRAPVGTNDHVPPH